MGRSEHEVALLTSILLAEGLLLQNQHHHNLRLHNIPQYENGERARKEAGVTLARAAQWASGLHGNTSRRACSTTARSAGCSV